MSSNNEEKVDLVKKAIQNRPSRSFSSYFSSYSSALLIYERFMVGRTTSSRMEKCINFQVTEMTQYLRDLGVETGHETLYPFMKKLSHLFTKPYQKSGWELSRERSIRLRLYRRPVPIEDFKLEEEAVRLIEPEELEEDDIRRQEILEIAIHLLQRTQPNLEGADQEAALEALLGRIVGVMFPPDSE